MKKNCVIAGFLFAIVCGMTACGSILPKESVVAMEPEIIVIKDEVVVPMAQQPDNEKVIESGEKNAVEEKQFVTADSSVEETYVVLPSANVEEEIADGRVDESDFAADIQGTVVRLDEEIYDYINTLGEPDDFAETVRNPQIGSDKEYIYNGIVIHTSPENGRDIVNCIEYRGEEKTISGIGLGSTRADIEAAYGIDYLIDPDYIIYNYGENASISFQMEGEECVYIELSWR